MTGPLDARVARRAVLPYRTKQDSDEKRNTMRRFLVELTTAEAAYVVDTVKAIDAEQQVDVWDENSGAVTLALSQGAVRALRDRLGTEDDGYIDDDGRLWIDSWPNRLHVVDNF
jgi:hypothetical protein